MNITLIPNERIGRAGDAVDIRIINLDALLVDCIKASKVSLTNGHPALQVLPESRKSKSVFPTVLRELIRDAGNAGGPDSIRDNAQHLALLVYVGFLKSTDEHLRFRSREERLRHAPVGGQVPGNRYAVTELFANRIQISEVERLDAILPRQNSSAHRISLPGLDDLSCSLHARIVALHLFRIIGILGRRPACPDVFLDQVDRHHLIGVRGL